MRYIDAFTTYMKNKKWRGLHSQLLHGDANEKICEIVREIPRRTLTLAFLDPYGLHLDYETLKVLSSIRADLIIFFPDHLDALRNWEYNYLAWFK